MWTSGRTGHTERSYLPDPAERIGLALVRRRIAPELRIPLYRRTLFVTLPETPVAGPRFVPLIAMIMPGASRVASLRAAFSTDRITGGVAAATTNVTVIVCAGVVEFVPVTATVPV